MKVRFAPSPTGELHVGNLRTALINYLFARKKGAQFMLRIDDTDTERTSASFEESIRKDLKWMGMNWDFEDRQSKRLHQYNAALERLVRDGRAYACYETSEELALKRRSQLASGRPPVYDRAGLELTSSEKSQLHSEGRRPHWRFLLEHSKVTWCDMVRGETAFNMSSLSDPVLIREDGRVIYTMASVVDDIEHGITHILRGEDHVTNSAAQIQMFEALGGQVPAMGHVALIAGAGGEGLSKRLGSLSVRELRSEGFEPEALASLLSKIGSADPVEVFTDMNSIIEGFDITRYGRATAKFDVNELSRINRQLLQTYPFEKVKKRLIDCDIGGDAFFWEAVRGNVKNVEEAKIWWNICTDCIEPVITEPSLTEAAANLLPDGKLDSNVWEDWISKIRVDTGVTGKSLFMPLRLALTGLKTGPELPALLALMGRERILARLRGDFA